MPITLPDIIRHNNPVLALIDSDFVKGGGRIVADLTALYALSTYVDQLKERVTKVYVTAEIAYYDLTDISNVGNLGGWTLSSSGSGGSGPWVVSGSDIYYNTGKVGIGTTAPSEKLDVTGNIKASGTILGPYLSGTNTGDNATNSQYSGLAASKQNNITLTTTGSSGPATLVGSTLNIPQYTGSGGGLTSSNFIFKEKPSGTVDGVNNTFLLDFTPVTNSEHVVVNGIQQDSESGDEDYIITANSITFVTGAIPISGSKIRVSYIK